MIQLLVFSNTYLIQFQFDFFLLLAFCPVSSSYHSVLSLLWRGNFFFIHFLFLEEGILLFFVLHLFVCKEVFSLFFYRERTCDACICTTISVKYFFMIVKRFYSLPLNRKRGKSIFSHLVILHVVVRELFFHNKIFYLQTNLHLFHSGCRSSSHETQYASLPQNKKKC